MTTPDPKSVMERYLELHAVFDFDGMRSCLSPDVKIWYNTMPGAGFFGVEDAIARIQGMTAFLDEMEFIFDRTGFSAGSQFALEVTCRAKTKGGTEFFCPAAFIGSVNADGRLSAYNEFIDPAPMAPLLTEIAQSQTG
jgi:hypothetical protein